jgi:hypothetical protein
MRLSPRLTVENPLYCGNANTELFGKFHRGLGDATQTNTLNHLLGQLRSISSSIIRSDCDWLRMVRVDTACIAANVVENEAIGDFSPMLNKRPAMGKVVLPVDCNVAVSLSVASTFPIPATSRIINVVTVRRDFLRRFISALMTVDPSHRMSSKCAGVSLIVDRNLCSLSAPTQTQTGGVWGILDRAYRNATSVIRTRSAPLASNINFDTTVRTRVTLSCILGMRHLLTSYIGRGVRRGRSVDALPAFCYPKLYQNLRIIFESFSGLCGGIVMLRQGIEIAGFKTSASNGIVRAIAPTVALADPSFGAFAQSVKPIKFDNGKRLELTVRELNLEAMRVRVGIILIRRHREIFSNQNRLLNLWHSASFPPSIAGVAS